MKNLKILIVALAASISLLTFSACTQEKCDSTCPICNLCTDDNCAVHTAGNQHCQGHATPVEQVAVVNILNDNTAYKNMVDSAAEIIYDEIKEAVAEEYNVAKNKVELSYVRIDGEGYEPTTVVAKIDNKKVVLLQYETDTINEHLPRDVEGLVLNEAGYKADDKVDQDKQSQVDAEFTLAVNAILARFATISDEITLVKANEIFSEFSSTTAVPGFENCEGIILSDVREDGTVVAFTYTNGTYQDHVLKVEGRENMTDAQIMAQIAAGNFTKTTRTIDPSKAYTAPAVEQKPVVEYVNFNEVYNEIFGEDFAFTSPTELFNSVLPVISSDFTDNKLLFYVKNEDGLTLYSEGIDAIGRAVFAKSEYKGSDFEKINKYMTKAEEFATGIKTYFETKYEVTNIEVGSLEETVLKNEMNAIKTELDEGATAISSATKSDFSRSKIMTGTKDSVDRDAFGEKLCPDREVIATYVGAMSGRGFNDTFGTGYVCAFDVLYVYKGENSSIVINQTGVRVPWYTDSTNESLYNSFINGDKYTLFDSTTETIKNATVAKQNEKQKLASIQVLNEYDIESPDEESAEIVADAVAAYFADELAR